MVRSFVIALASFGSTALLVAISAPPVPLA